MCFCFSFFSHWGRGEPEANWQGKQPEAFSFVVLGAFVGRKRHRQRFLLDKSHFLSSVPQNRMSNCRISFFFQRWRTKLTNLSHEGELFVICLKYPHSTVNSNLNREGGSGCIIPWKVWKSGKIYDNCVVGRNCRQMKHKSIKHFDWICHTAKCVQFMARLMRLPSLLNNYFKKSHLWGSSGMTNVYLLSF